MTELSALVVRHIGGADKADELRQAYREAFGGSELHFQAARLPAMHRAGRLRVATAQQRYHEAYVLPAILRELFAGEAE